MKNENIKKTDWGYELHWAKNENYSAKILVFEQIDSSDTMCFHVKTDKTFFINSGKFTLRYIDTNSGNQLDREFNEGDTVNIPPLTPYQWMCNVPNSSITEVANQNSDNDTYKI